MRLALFATLLTTAFAAAPLYADKPDKPDKGDKKDREEQKDRKEHADGQADLSPWIQAWAKEGIKGRELTERLEKLMDQQRAGKLPPPPGAKKEARDGDQEKQAGHREEGEKKEREEAEKGKGAERQPPPFGRGPGMRGFGGGPGMRGGGFGMRGFGGGEDGRPGMREFAQAHAQVQAQLQELKTQVARLHEELSKLERRMESDKPGKGPRDREARPEKPRKERRHDKDDDDDHDDHDKI
jgi:hypothetical protein